MWSHAIVSTSGTSHMKGCGKNEVSSSAVEHIKFVLTRGTSASFLYILSKIVDLFINLMKVWIVETYVIENLLLAEVKE